MCIVNSNESLPTKVLDLDGCFRSEDSYHDYGDSLVCGRGSSVLWLLLRGGGLSVVFFNCPMLRSEKNSLNIKFLGGIFLGHPGPRRRDIPDKNFMQVAFFCCFREGAAGMSRDLGRDVPDLVKLYARKLWADFSYPKCRSCRGV